MSVVARGVRGKGAVVVGPLVGLRARRSSGWGWVAG